MRRADVANGYFTPIADIRAGRQTVAMEGNAAYGLYCALIGGTILTWGTYAGRLPVPFLRLSASDERVWYWSNMTGAGLAILIGLWFIFN